MCALNLDMQLTEKLYSNETVSHTNCYHVNVPNLGNSNKETRTLSTDTNITTSLVGDVLFANAFVQMLPN